MFIKLKMYLTWDCVVVLQHFTAVGFPCPALRNPSDHFLRAINADFDQVKATLRGSFRIRVSHILIASYIR